MTNQRSPVHTFDEWSRLEEVIVGSPNGYSQHHLDPSFRLFYLPHIEPLARDRSHSDGLVPIPNRIQSELAEDVAGFVTVLEQFGATVRRPAKFTTPSEIRSPYWRAHTSPPLNVRDQTLILGDTIIDTPPHVRGRFFETDHLKPEFYEYFRAGSRWLSFPKPTLGRGSLDPSYYDRLNIDARNLLQGDNASALDGLGFEMIFDGAQCLRFGRDVLVNVANANHHMALIWLQREFSDRFRFHRLESFADNHIDSIVLPLRPGFLLARSRDYVRLLPRELSTWDVLVAPDAPTARFPDYGADGINIAGPYIDLNVFSLDEHTVVVNSLYPELIPLLEAKQFTVIPVRHRHRRLFGGGFHCFTLDTIRAGGLEDYFRG